MFQNINKIVRFAVVFVYAGAAIAIWFIPAFANVSVTYKIILSVIMVLYSAMRLYRSVRAARMEENEITPGPDKRQPL